MKHYNPTISADINRILNLKGESTSEISEEIIAVIPIIPKCNIVRSIRAINASNVVTLFTTPTDKDFYLTNAALNFIKDASATSTVSDITVYIDGVLQTLLRIDQITLTAQTGSIAESYPIPIKIDRGTNITVEHGTAVANITTSGMIKGYTVETKNGSQ